MTFHDFNDATMATEEAMTDARELPQHLAWLKVYVGEMNTGNWRDMKLRCERQLEAIDAFSPGSPSGWKLVPIEPNLDMGEAGMGAYCSTEGELRENALKAAEALLADTAQEQDALRERLGEAVEAIEQINTVCEDNAGPEVKHDLALRFVGNVASRFLVQEHRDGLNGQARNPTGFPDAAPKVENAQAFQEGSAGSHSNLRQVGTPRDGDDLVPSSQDAPRYGESGS